MVFESDSYDFLIELLSQDASPGVDGRHNRHAALPLDERHYLRSIPNAAIAAYRGIRGYTESSRFESINSIDSDRWLTPHTAPYSARSIRVHQLYRF